MLKREIVKFLEANISVMKRTPNRYEKEIGLMEETKKRLLTTTKDETYKWLDLLVVDNDLKPLKNEILYRF